MIQAAELAEQKAQLIAYLLSKVKAGDFHAVQDAASDIREIDAKREVLNAMTPTLLYEATGIICNHLDDVCRYDPVVDEWVCTCGMRRSASPHSRWYLPKPPAATTTGFSVPVSVSGPSCTR